jgi:hypothetical protein
MQLRRGDIDRHLDSIGPLAPFEGGGAGGIDHVSADFVDESRLFSNRDKCRGRHESAFRMHPPRECLCCDDPPCFKIELRLIEGDDLVTSSGSGQVGEEAGCCISHRSDAFTFQLASARSIVIWPNFPVNAYGAIQIAAYNPRSRIR